MGGRRRKLREGARRSLRLIRSRGGCSSFLLFGGLSVCASRCWIPRGCFCFCVFSCGLLLFFFFFLSYSSIAVSWSRWVYIYQRSVVHAFESSRVVLRCGQWRETVRVIISFADSERKQKRTNQIQTCNSQWSRALMFAIVLLVT